MAAKKPTHKIGDVWEFEGHALVRRPDGVVVTCTGHHVLNRPGEYVLNPGTEAEKTAYVAEPDDK